MLAQHAVAGARQHPGEVVAGDGRAVAQQRPRRVVLEHHHELVAPLQAPVAARVASRGRAAHVVDDGRRLVARGPSPQPRPEAPVDVLEIGLEVAVERADVGDRRHPVGGGATAGAEDLARLVVAAAVGLAPAAAARRARPAQRVARAVEDVPAGEAQHLAGRRGGLRVTVEHRDEPGHEPGRQLEVVVEQDEVLAAGRDLDRAVERPGHAEVDRVAHELDPRERRGHPLRGSVGRRVVEHDEAQVAGVLGDQRGQHRLEQLAAVVGEDDRRGPGREAHASPSPASTGSSRPAASAAPARAPSHHARAGAGRRSAAKTTARTDPDAANATPRTAR